MSKIVLITGGARSGKSKFAENYAAKCGEHVAYIATAQVADDEMRQRVRKHQLRRPPTWETFESPTNAHLAIRSAASRSEAILFDCVTVYLSNILMDVYDKCDDPYPCVEKEISRLIDAARAYDGTVVFVTNEVGAGIVPENKLARCFRDLAGFANQLIAAAADEVFLVTCGIGVDIKKLAAHG